MSSDTHLREVQQDCLEVLVEFDRVCKELNLPYFLTAGTLLGAVRHNGFIPWDDDVDVVMVREDYEQLSKRASCVVGKGFFFQDYRNTPEYPMGFAKLRKQNSNVKESILTGAAFEMGAFVDIFPLDLCPANPHIAKIFFYLNTIINYALIKRCNSCFDPGKMKFITRVLWKTACIMPNIVLFWARETLRKAAGVFSDGKKLCTVSGRHGYPKEAYDAGWFAESVLLEFEGHFFPAPIAWPNVLENMYGDYMTPLKDSDGHIQ